MPKIICLCSEVINLSDIPSPNQLLMIEDKKYDQYFSYSDPEKLYSEMILVVRCQKCKRLYIYENGFNQNPIIYQLEQNNWNT